MLCFGIEGRGMFFHFHSCIVGTGNGPAIFVFLACGYINLQHLRSECNIADILTKHWGYQSTYELIRPIFHFGGNTAALYFDDTLEVDRSITPSELEDIITINGEC